LNHPLLRAALTVAMVAALAMLAGLGFGAPTGWAVLALGALAMLAYHVAKLAALIRWLRQPGAIPLPEARGAWDEAFALLYRFERAADREAERLSRALMRWRQAGEALPDGVVILDAQNRIEWCNEGAGRHFGLDLRADVSWGNLVDVPSPLGQMPRVHPGEHASRYSVQVSAFAVVSWPAR